MKILVLALLCIATTLTTSWAEPLRPLRSAAELDSLTRQLRHGPADTTRVNVLLALGEDLLDRHWEQETPPGLAATYAAQAEVLSARLHYRSGQLRTSYLRGRLLCLEPATLPAGQALLAATRRQCEQPARPRLLALGWYYLGDSYPDTPAGQATRLACFGQALQQYQQLGDRLSEAYLLKAIADAHLWQGNSPQALRELLQALDIYRAAGYPRLHYTYDLLLIANRQVGNYQAALRNGLDAVESAQASRDTLAIGLFYSRIAKLYEEMNQPNEARVYFERSLLNARATHQPIAGMAVGGHLARLLIRQHQPRQALRQFLAATPPAFYQGATAHSEALISLAECYVALRDYSRAEQLYRQLLTARLTDPADSQIDDYTSLGRFYLLTGRYGQARQYLRQAMTLSSKLGTLTGTATLHLLLFRADSAQGNFPAAITHFHRYKDLTDSVFNATKSKQIASLEIQYDTRKKEQNITLLRQQNQLVQAALRQREWQRNATLAGAVLLLLLLGLGYNRYRLKQRSNELLQAKQQEINAKNQSLEQVLDDKNELLEEKEWMLAEIHHRVKNNLQIVSELLSSQTARLTDAPALAVLRESQHRVQAMALVHQKLYQTRNLARVAMLAYITELVDYLLASFNRETAVRPQLDVAPVELDVALATPVGLILNEALTNVLKHAFAPGQPGRVWVSLAALPSGRYRLRIADDGRGWPAGFDATTSRSMGLTMIRGLSKQIDATLSFFGPAGGGVCLLLEFAAPARAARVG